MRSDLRRTCVLGMGCYGAFPALQRAREAVAHQPGRTALVLALELCSLHLQDDDSLENMVVSALFADGADTTRVVFRVTDEFGAIRPFSNDAIQLDLEGPAALVGDNPFAVVGGTGAVWIRAKEQPGSVRLTATHPVLGQKQVQIELVATFPETV